MRRTGDGQGGTPAGTRWAAVLAIVGAGVVAALQVGKVIIASRCCGGTWGWTWPPSVR